MNSNQVEEVKSKTNIVSLISEYIEVKKAGRNYKANCPFHGEKTPSFMISQELQIYKCFGCARHGDAFTFLEEHEGMEFKEALKYLAEKAGIKLTSNIDKDSTEKELSLEINKSTLFFYNYALNTHPSGKKILDYLQKDRGLKKETIKEFQIGYSPENYDALNKYLVEKKKFKTTDLIKTGNLVGRGIDRFRGRVVFPLFDHRDNCIGFAGRILPWVKQDMAKYINSPDSPVYHKSKVLYGLNKTKNYIRDQKFAIIVEGELDMISTYQAGIKNVIAIKGSALTEDQIRLIGRFAQTIVLCLDSDFAGNEAAKRGALLAENMGFEVKVCELVGYKDPDEIAKANPNEFKKIITQAVGIWDFIINSVISKYGTETGENKKKISSEIMPLISSIQDKIVQAHYVELLARKLSVPQEAVMAELQNKNMNITVAPKKEDKNNKDRRELLEEKLLVNCIDKNKELLFKEETKSLVSSKFIRKIIDFIENNDSPLPQELQSGYNEMVLSNSEEDDVNLIIKELTILDTKQKLEELGEKIKKDEGNDELLKEFSILSKKLSSL